MQIWIARIRENGKRRLLHGSHPCRPCSQAISCREGGEDFERGKAIIARQACRVKSLMADGDRVAAETEGTWVLAIPLGTLKPGDAMKADFGVFFRSRDAGSPSSATTTASTPGDGRSGGARRERLGPQDLRRASQE